MLAVDGAAVGTVRRQFQRMVENLGNFSEFETRKSSVVRISETWRKNETKRLTDQLIIGPSVNVAKALVDLQN